MDRTYFETEFKNHRKTSVTIHENGRVLLTLDPGEKKFVESFDPKTSYARWFRVTFSGDDKISFDENHTWKWPFGDNLCLEVLNIDGTPTESFPVAGEFYQCYRGIPRYVPVDIHDRKWAFIARLEWRLVEYKVREGDFIIRKKILEDVKTMRSRKEIKAIQKQLEDAAVEKARREVQQQFPKSADTEANGI